MMEFAGIFADGLPTAVYVCSSLVCLAAFAAMALWMTVHRAPNRSTFHTAAPERKARSGWRRATLTPCADWLLLDAAKESPWLWPGFLLP